MSARFRAYGCTFDFVGSGKIEGALYGGIIPESFSGIVVAEAPPTSLIGELGDV